MSFSDSVRSLFDANGWATLEVETLNAGQAPERIRVRLAPNHLSAPGAVINEYTEGLNDLEQIQYECLRAIRTGRPGS